MTQAARAAAVLLAVTLIGCQSSLEDGAMSTQVVGAGTTVIDEDGTVVRNQRFEGPVVIRADDVRIEDSVITGGTSEAVDQPLLLVEAGTRRTTITGTDVAGPATSPVQAVSGVKLYGDQIVFRDNTVSRIAGDGITLDGDRLTVVGNTVGDFEVREGVHYDAVTYAGDDTANRVLIADNRLSMWLPTGMTSLISLPARATGMRVSGNELAGGGYALVGGAVGASFTGNRFSTRFAPSCGSFGTHAHMRSGRQRPLWSGNVWADGPEAGLTVPF